MRVEDIMTKDVVTVSENDTVEKCANLLNKYDLSGLPVVDTDNHVIGIITEGDLIKHNTKVEVPAFLEILGGIIYLDDPNKYFENVRKSMGHFVSTVMTRDVITVSPDQEIEATAKLVARKKIKRLPVVDEDEKLIGIIARRDIMNYLFANDD